MTSIPGADELVEPRLVPNLISMAKSMRSLQLLKLREAGFYNGHDELLILIDEKGITVSRLADQLSVRASTVSKMLDKLTERGLAERVGDKEDGRRALVRITSAGVGARNELLQIRSKLENYLTDGLSETKLAALLVTLGDCQELLSKKLSRIR